MRHSHTNLTLLPACLPENVFEPIVDRHHAEVRLRSAQRAEAERIHRLRRRVRLILAVGVVLSAVLGVLVGSGILPLA